MTDEHPAAPRPVQPLVRRALLPSRSTANELRSRIGCGKALAPVAHVCPTQMSLSAAYSPLGVIVDGCECVEQCRELVLRAQPIRRADMAAVREKH